MAGSAWTNQVVTQVIIVGTNGQILIYSPALTAGDLVYSVSSQAGTDTVGDAYLAGFATYQDHHPAFANWTATALQNGKLAVYQASTEAGPWSLLTSIAVGQNSSLGPPTHLDIGSGGGVPVIFLDPVSSPRGLQGTLPIIQVDVSTNTAGNNNTAADITTAWSVPASDGVKGTTYTIKGLVRVNTGQTTIETLTLGVDIDGTKTALATLGTAFNGGALNTVYSVPFELVLIVDEIGTDVPGIYLQAPLADESANRLATNSANLNGHTDGASWAKASSHTLALYAQWGGAGGSDQNAHTTSSRLYREGP